MSGIQEYRGWKTHARTVCRAITRDYPDGPVNGQAGDFLAALLARHPDATQKIGPGVAYITLEPVPGYPSRGFIVHRIDGSSTDFSWLDCITTPQHHTKVFKAMRVAVARQSIAFKQAEADTGQLQCAVCGSPCGWDDVHVDHLPPEFAALASAFATAAGGYDKIPLVPSADGMIGPLLDPAIEVVWVKYHQEQARLQILCIPCHKAKR